MSDRVAVFNDGVIQQLAPPSDLYERPENAFVAQFIGENNRFSGTVTARNGDEVEVDVSGHCWRATAIACGDVGSRTTLSVRPERVHFGDGCANQIEAYVKELIFLGDHIRAHLSMDGGCELTVKVPNCGEAVPLTAGRTTRVVLER